MVWLRNEVAALIAVFVCYKVVTWTLRATLTLASQFRQKGEKVEGRKVPPYSCTLAAFRKGHWWGRASAGRAQPPQELSAGPASPRSSSFQPARWWPYCKQNQSKQSLEDSCPKLSSVEGTKWWLNERVWNPKSFSTAISSQETNKFRQWQEGCKKRGTTGGKGGLLLGAGKAQTAFPVDQEWTPQQARGCCVWLLVSTLEQHSDEALFLLKGLRLSHSWSLWACLSPSLDWSLLV